MSEIIIPQKKDRVWEIDAIRGLLILCVLATHLYFTVDAFCIDGYYKIDSYAYVNATDPLHFWFDWGSDGVIYRAFLTPKLVKIWIYLGVDVFFILSGLSSLFSRNNLRRGLIMIAAGYTISLFTKLLVLWTGDATQFIRFGVLQCYGYCHIIYYFLFEKKDNKVLWVVLLIVLVLGYYFKYNPVYIDSPFLYPFGIQERNVVARDYWPLFPMLGWMLLGVIVGRKLYRQKRSLFPNWKLRKYTRFLQYIGRHSGKIYFSHIFIYTAVFCGIGCFFKLL